MFDKSNLYRTLYRTVFTFFGKLVEKRLNKAVLATLVSLHLYLFHHESSAVRGATSKRKTLAAPRYGLFIERAAGTLATNTSSGS